MKKDCVKKALAATIILFFIGLAFTPNINANISENDELINITTEAYGVNGIRPHTIKLTEQESEELDILIDSIKERLNKAETIVETVEVFNDAIVGLDKYGLLGDLSLKQAQHLITKGFQKLKLLQTFDKNSNKWNLPIGYRDWKNLFCFIYMTVEDVWMYWDVMEVSIPFLLSFTYDFFWFLREKSHLIPFRLRNIIIILDPGGPITLSSLGLKGFKTETITGLDPYCIFGFKGLVIKYNLRHFEYGDIIFDGIYIGHALGICGP